MKIVDPKTGEEKQIIVSVDDGIRPNANLADLAKLKPAFKKDGTTTAGNASQVSDGAAAVLLMKRSIAVQKGLPILGIFRYTITIHILYHFKTSVQTDSICCPSVRFFQSLVFRTLFLL